MSGIRAKQRAINRVIRARGATDAKCVPKITVEKGGARGCKTCGARAQTAKSVMLCGRTGRLPGVRT